MTAFGARNAVNMLRISLGAVFYWFGILKVSGHSPVEQLVGSAIPWLPPQYVVPSLGLVEMAIGIGLVFEIALPATLCLFALQMAGTLSVFVTRPDLTFQGHSPLLLTADGEFIAKNLVLMAAGAVIAATFVCRQSEATLAGTRAQAADRYEVGLQAARAAAGGPPTAGPRASGAATVSAPRRRIDRRELAAKRLRRLAASKSSAHARTATWAA